MDITEHNALVARKFESLLSLSGNATPTMDYAILQKGVSSGLFEVYEKEGLTNFLVDLQKAYDEGDVTPEQLLKAHKNLSALAQRRIIDKNGVARIVWVKVTQDPKTGKHKEQDIEVGDAVTAKHPDGSLQQGVVEKHFVSKDSPVGTVRVKFKDGKTADRSMAGIEKKDISINDPHYKLPKNKNIDGTEKVPNTTFSPSKRDTSESGLHTQKINSKGNTTETSKSSAAKQKEFTKFLDKTVTSGEFNRYANKEMAGPMFDPEEEFDESDNFQDTDFIEGLCDIFATFVYHKFEGKGVEVFSAGDDFHHTFIKYEGKFYDGLDRKGVDKFQDLEFFADNPKRDKLKPEPYDWKRAPHNPPEKAAKRK